MPLDKVAFAEYAAIHQNAVARVPAYLSDEEAACVPLTALTALQALELPKEFGILKAGGKLVSLRGMPNGEFTARTGMPTLKRMLFKLAGRKYDRMAAKKHQKYYFIFVHEDGKGWSASPGFSRSGRSRRPSMPYSPSTRSTRRCKKLPPENPKAKQSSV